MALNVTTLFDAPQSEIATLLNQKISSAKNIKIVTGFATVEGIKALESSLQNNTKALEALIIGAGTFKAYEAFDRLIELGISNDNLYVHLGHTRFTKAGAAHPFYRYHPMLHSKIYYFENMDGTACAFVGSHNMTGFALKGLNGEASVMLEGLTTDPEFAKIRKHIELAQREALKYSADMKQAYSWWTHEFMEGLAQKVNDSPREMEKKKTILIFTESQKHYPKKNDIVYFELPEALGKVQSLRADIHIFVFEKLPESPSDCLLNLTNAARTFWCRVEGIENNKGGKELTADWFIDDNHHPLLKRTTSPFRPLPRFDMQQIRVKLLNSVFENFEYLFGKQLNGWLPILNMQKQINYPQSFSKEIEGLNIIPESNEWYLVTSLEPEQEEAYNDSKYELALKSLDPDSGAFILFSTARKKLDR